MRFQSISALASSALVVGILAAPSVFAGPNPVAVSDGGMVTPVWTPLGISKQPVTVVVELSGEPVALHQERAGRKLARAEKERIKGALKGQQDALRGNIQALGGNVLAQFQSSYNGMKVRIARDRTAALAALPGVVAVRPLQVFKPNATASISPDNVRGVPMIGAPSVWQTLGLRGENIKIGIIDTGIDYTHANFGGPGTAAAYAAAHAAETAPANPAHFGPAAPRVKGGIDLVGDDYDASADPDAQGNPSPKLIPHPDPNPLDCNGHGSHVAGSAAGSGVTAAGATYTGQYNSSTISSQSWNIAPGVAPKADLYAIRVFGCLGSTDVVVEAIEWAVDNDLDVINMSLGSPFGSKDDPSAVATSNAARAGVIVVTSAGNSGPSQYITGSPGTAEGAIATAANDPWPTIPGATISVPAAPGSVTAINANGFPLSTASFSVKIVRDNAATADRNESLGCSASDFGAIGPNTIAVVERGVCARVAKAIFGQQAGAAAVVMINNVNGLPPFEGPITANPDDGVPFNVTIPFLGISSADRARIQSADTLPTNVAAVNLNNTNFTGFASFSSGGPRTGDGALKPDITAPGVSILSTGVGTGNAGAVISGTSMASPHVAGVAALTRQAHPDWKVDDIKAAIVGTAQPSGVGGATPYRTSRAGAGLAQPAGSTGTQVVAKVKGKKFDSALSFGVQELKSNFSGTKEIVLYNKGSSPATFNIAQARAAGSPHTLSFSRASVQVPARGDASVSVTLAVPASSAGASDAFREVAGLIEFTPQNAGGVALRMPYYLVARPQADVSTVIGSLQGASPSTTATVTNRKGVVAGDADFYAWGLSDTQLTAVSEDGEVEIVEASHDVRAVGAQSFAFPSPTDASRRLLVFAVNTYQRWSNAATNEFDIEVDVDGNGSVDYVVIGADQGAVQTGTFNGVMGSFVFSTRSAGASIAFLASAPSDSSTALLPVLSSQLCRVNEPCLSQAANPRITYRATSFDLVNGGVKEVAGSARFNVWSSSISQGGFVEALPPGATDRSVGISVNRAEWALTPAKGLMVVTFDNKSGEREAQLISVDLP
jgi:minor extracellular serine protease Vpr